MDSQILQLIAMGRPYLFLNKRDGTEYVLYLIVPVFEGLSIRKVGADEDITLTESNKEVEVEFDIYPLNEGAIDYNSIQFEARKITINVSSDELVFNPTASANGVYDGTGDSTASTPATTLELVDDEEILSGYRVGAKINSPNGMIRKYSLSLNEGSDLEVTEHTFSLSYQGAEAPKNQVIACNCPYFFPLLANTMQVEPKLLIPLRKFEYEESMEILQDAGDNCSLSITLIQNPDDWEETPDIVIPLHINQHEHHVNDPEEVINFEIELILGTEGNALRRKVKPKTKPADTF